MPAYRVAITDDDSVSEALEHHASLKAAEQSVAATAMRMLMDQGCKDQRRVAECEISQVGSDAALLFTVAIEVRASLA